MKTPINPCLVQRAFDTRRLKLRLEAFRRLSKAIEPFDGETQRVVLRAAYQLTEKPKQ
jgi:hypothetical protein